MSMVSNRTFKIVATVLWVTAAILLLGALVKLRYVMKDVRELRMEMTK